MSTTAAPVTIDQSRPGIPLSRLVRVELRKMFNTRSGFWLMMSIAILATVATVVVILVLALAIAAVGNIVGNLIVGTDTVWDVGVDDFLLILLANVLGLLIGFMLGVLIRNSAAAIVAYFVYSFVLPGLLALLANVSDWFKDLQPWVDFNFAQGQLFDPPVSGEEWAQLLTSGIIWFVIPLAVGVRMVLRSEVK